MARAYRLSEPWSRGPAADHASWLSPHVEDGRLYDEAHGPGNPSRPIRFINIRPAVNEWDDPRLDAVILIVDALAAVDDTRRRNLSHNYSQHVRSHALDGYGHWLDAQQVAARCGVPLPTVYSWRRRGLGPLSVRLGGYRRWDPDAVERHARELDRQRAAGKRARRPGTPTGPWHITRTTPNATQYWTGTRWSPDATKANRYRQHALARTIADSLGATAEPAD